MGYRSIISLMPKTTAVDPDAQAVIDAIEGTGVTLTPTQISSTNKLIKDCKNADIWLDSSILYGVIGGSAAAHKFNWIDPQDLDSSFRLDFFGGWTHSATGALPNGTNAFANTYLYPYQHLTQYNTSVSFYSRVDNDGVFFDIGSFDSAPIRNLTAIYCKIGGNCIADLGNYQDTRITQSVSDSLGLYTINRTAINEFKLYKNGVLIGTNTNNDTSQLSTSMLTISAVLWNGGYHQFSNRELSFVHVGKNMTDAKVLDLYNAAQAFQTSQNRQV